MKKLIRMTVVVIVVALFGTVMPRLADAQSFSAARPGGRGGSWDFFLSPVYSDSVTIDGKGGSSVDLDDDWGFGLGVGYNFNDHFQLNGLVNWFDRDYDAMVVQSNGTTQRYSNDMESFTFSLNGVFYFLKGNITPFVSGGVGYTWVDTNIPDGPPVGACWYDPWWGYVCDSYTPTRTEDDFSFNAGLGIRADFSRQFGMQLGFYRNWIDFDNTAGTQDIDTWRLDFIFRFGN